MVPFGLLNAMRICLPMIMQSYAPNPAEDARKWHGKQAESIVSIQLSFSYVCAGMPIVQGSNPLHIHREGEHMVVG